MRKSISTPNIAMMNVCPTPLSQHALSKRTSGSFGSFGSFGSLVQPCQALPLLFTGESFADIAQDFQAQTVVHATMMSAAQCGFNHKVMSAPSLSDIDRGVAICIATPEIPEEKPTRVQIEALTAERLERLWKARRRHRERSSANDTIDANDTNDANVEPNV